MLLSIAVCTHNEGSYLVELFSMLTSLRRTSLEHEIVVLDDFSTDITTRTALDLDFAPFIRSYPHALNGDFAAHKNYMTNLCLGDWVLNLDGDEMLDAQFIQQIPEIIETNPTIDAYYLPRANTVQGLTENHIRQWGWNMTIDIRYPLPLVNYPDFQCRLYRKDPRIVWKNKVHEVLTGVHTYGTLPTYGDYDIQHHKMIDRQEQQNNFYTTLV